MSRIAELLSQWMSITGLDDVPGEGAGKLTEGWEFALKDGT